jgi:hypothetical protein
LPDDDDDDDDADAGLAENKVHPTAPFNTYLILFSLAGIFGRPVQSNLSQIPLSALLARELELSLSRLVERLAGCLGVGYR